jgi:hypothetical protein
VGFWKCDIDFCETCHTLDKHEHTMTIVFPYLVNYIRINTFNPQSLEEIL